MSLDPAYVTSVDLSPYLADKDTGAPLAGGVIQFWQDDARSVPKSVYELTGSPPNYTYAALPNPVVLSATGTIEDANGNSCALYYYPYDAEGNIQLYYVVVLNSLGVIQFTREAWPNVTDESSPITSQNNTIVNLLSNPQFADVLFNPAIPLVIPFSSMTEATMTVAIAPDWNLNISYLGSGNVTVQRTTVAGSADAVTNPPYLLSITPGSSITMLTLSQRLYNNAGIWSPQPGGPGGYVAATIALGNNTTAQIYYVPSHGTKQPILMSTNMSGALAVSYGTALLTPSNNPDTGDTGYIDISIYLSTTNVSQLTSVQIVALDNNDTNIAFQQTPVNRQRDQLFHYYDPLLQAKPISSYLIGWDFPYNPAQFLGTSVPAQALGTNTSYYAWDQTIIFQTATSGVTISQSANGAFTATCNAAATQIALIQYLDQATARDLLAGRLSVNMNGTSSSVAGISGKITLWYTTGATLPDMNANQSLVQALDATGKPTSFHFAGGQGWTEVTRSGLGDAVFTLSTTSENSQFSGWEDLLTGSTTATFFAIVVGTVQLTNTAPDTLNFLSISLVPGDIATQPAPKTPDQVLRECERFYEQSYSSGTTAGSITDLNALLRVQGAYKSAPSGGSNFLYVYIDVFDIEFKEEKRSTTPLVSLYSTTTGAVDNLRFQGFYNTLLGYDVDIADTVWTVTGLGDKRVSYIPNNAVLMWNANISPTAAGLASWVKFHYVCDCRLGIV